MPNRWETPKNKIRQRGGLCSSKRGFFYSFNAGVKRRAVRASALNDLLGLTGRACIYLFLL